MPLAILYMFFTSQEINTKRSPNAAKLFVDFFGPEDIKWAKKAPEGSSEGSTTHQGTQEAQARQGGLCPPGPGAPRWVVPTSVASRTPSLHYKFPNIPKPFGVNLDQKFCRCKASVSTRSNLDPVPAPCRRGESSPVAIFIIPAATMMMRE